MGEKADLIGRRFRESEAIVENALIAREERSTTVEPQQVAVSIAEYID